MVSSCHNDNEINTGVSEYSWEKDASLQMRMDNPLILTFTADADWTASADSSWCLLFKKEGKAGYNEIKLLPLTVTGVERFSNITINVEGYSPNIIRVGQKPDKGLISEDMQIIVQMDNYLRDYYLWNDEYVTLNVDYTKKYDDFLNSTLSSMTTNGLDNKLYPEYGEDYHRLFSFINKRTWTKAEKTTEYVEKELQINFGITGLGIAFLYDYIAFIVQGVYHDSPAERAYIKRGTIIKQIDGNDITLNNINDYYMDLLQPASSHTLKLMDNEGKVILLTSTAMLLNPIIFTQIEEVNGHRIGYLVYNSFDSSFDKELFDVFKYFKNQNITDLVLDLRYNRGGSIWAANMISSCIVGKECDGKPFAIYEFNPTRMKKMKKGENILPFMYSNYENLKMSLAQGDLGLKHLYCLVTNTSASASELVVNSLRGIDIQVTLIGITTMGKNVGMELKEIYVGNNLYDFYPITFKTSNAKGFGEYEHGLVPDIWLDETDPYGEMEYYYLPWPYGSHKEFMYAEAVKQITGASVLSRSKAARSAKDSNIIKARKYNIKQISWPGHEGMIKY